MSNKKLLPEYFYSKLKKYAQDFQNNTLDPRIIALSGLRGIGKTSLLGFLYFDLLKDVQNKLFISVDELVQLMNWFNY